MFGPLHYERAKTLIDASVLTTYDIVRLTPKFWNFHFDMISARDMTTFIIATIHLNLCIDTNVSYICGEFMLTEVEHGLDTRNLETRVTMLEDGSFDLHSPSADAAKAMSPTTLLASIPRLAVVFARLFVSGEDRGVKPFVVNINTTGGIVAGITSRILFVRPGTKPLDHSITTFDPVRLPPEELLGPIFKPKNSRDAFLKHISRVSVGTLSLSIMGVSAIKIGNSIAEGDTLVLSIRLASEVLGQKYNLPPPMDRLHDLARLEYAMFDEALEKIASLKGGHRGTEFNSDILPRCRPLIESIGQLMAYKAARGSDAVASEVLGVFEKA
ncbi:hypothetical protein LX32DRAFT_711042 [Colletotrichum zoysiae]|uniref:Uncharacterized protein n=1 Tax=Colletotrichum zoysiae TaxID=1216348 RepID=A0AAD9H5W2_9PEZI|nr:hypothetical protein LX32DRAFT_711042 [Colletotrichum zoysiae]